MYMPGAMKRDPNDLLKGRKAKPNVHVTDGTISKNSVHVYDILVHDIVVCHTLCIWKQDQD